MMTDPVMIHGAPDGLSYERGFLEAHLARNRCALTPALIPSFSTLGALAACLHPRVTKAR